MRTFKKILLLLFALVVVFVGHILISTGFFRTIESKFEGKILRKVAINGAEDITISRIDSFALISSTNRLIYPPNEEEKGGLYLIDLTNNDFTPISLTSDFKEPFAPHGISMFKKDSSYQVMAINHTNQGHSIEVFELQSHNMNHVRTMRNPAMIRPNDLVLVEEDRFYFTNDHKYTEGIGKFLEEYVGLSVSNVVYFDGNNYKEVANGIAYANGINYDDHRKLLYVASPRDFLVKVYGVQKGGSLSFIEDIPCGTGVDNIELDGEGNLWIGGHPNLLRFTAYASGKKEIAPSEIIMVQYRKTGDYLVEKIYVNDGLEMSGSTVAATLGNLIFAGNVMDDKFLILERDVSGASP
jgi:arylesterase/paraoxonase